MKPAVGGSEILISWVEIGREKEVETNCYLCEERWSVGEGLGGREEGNERSIQHWYRIDLHL